MAIDLVAAKALLDSQAFTGDQLRATLSGAELFQFDSLALLKPIITGSIPDYFEKYGRLMAQQQYVSWLLTGLPAQHAFGEVNAYFMALSGSALPIPDSAPSAPPSPPIPPGPQAATRPPDRQPAGSGQTAGPIVVPPGKPLVPVAPHADYNPLGGLPPRRSYSLGTDLSWFWSVHRTACIVLIGALIGLLLIVRFWR